MLTQHQPHICIQQWWLIIIRNNGDGVQKFNLVLPVYHAKNNVVTVAVLTATVLVNHLPCC